jgi:transposase-like protein
MKRRRLAKDKIVALLKEAAQFEGSMREFCKRAGVSEQNIYRWKRQYGLSEDTNEASYSLPEESGRRTSNNLVEENERLKILVAELMLEQMRLLKALGKVKNKRAA